MTAAELRSKRLALGMTQRQFAEHVGVSERMVQYMESDNKPITKRTAKLAMLPKN